jgi:hypothetical protein
MYRHMEFGFISGYFKNVTISINTLGTSCMEVKKLLPIVLQTHP